MSSPFLNKSNLSIEDAWVQATANMNTYQAHELWEALVSHTPTEQWRPDSQIQGQNARNHGVKEESLAELWLAQHTRTANPDSWLGFLSRVATTYPDLKSDVVIRATWQGLASSYARAGRYEPAGSEKVLCEWLKAYPSAWNAREDVKNALLVQAVELNLPVLSQDLIDAGASPQTALRFVRSKEMYDLMIKSGASTFEASNPDPRTGNPVYEDKRKFEYTRKETVYESLLAREDKTFVSAQDREKIVGDMTRQRLKQSKSKPSAFSDSERSEMLFKTIAEAKKFKEVLSAIKACLPQAWGWKGEDANGGEINLLMAVAQRRDLDGLVDALGDKIPEASWAEKDSNGQTLLTRVMSCSSDGVSRPVNADVFAKIKAAHPPTAAQAIESISNLALKGSKVSCPIGELLPENTDQSAAEGINVWRLSREDFWKAVDDHAASQGAHWVKCLAKSLTKITRYGYGSDRNSSERWQDVLTSEKGQKKFFESRPEWATVALVTELNHARTKIASHWNKKPEHNVEPLRLAEAALVRWAPLGADIDLALPNLPTGEADAISENRQLLIAAAERAMLTERTKKTIQRQTKHVQGDLAL